MTPDRPLMLVGAGKMGGAMLSGWLEAGIDPASIVVIDPAASKTEPPLDAADLRICAEPPDITAAAIMMAVKPQLVGDVVPTMRPCRDARTLVVSVAAGPPIAAFTPMGDGPIIRAMPNTPAAIGQSATVAFGHQTSDDDRALGEHLLSAIGKVWWVDEESLLDAVTAVSGSGPAYVFHLAECLAEAGVRAGLPRELADGIARQTVVGAGALLGRSPLDPGTLRENVTSPGGTTAAALSVLRGDGRLEALMRDAVAAATKRSRELGAPEG